MDFQITEQISTLFENAPIGIGWTTIQGNFLAANDTLLQMTGYPEEQVLNSNVIEFYADPAQWSHLLEQLSTSDSGKDFGVALKHADGTLFFASVNVSKVFHDGQYVLLTMIEDVNEQVQLLEQLQTEIAERKLLEEELESQIKLVDGLLNAAQETVEIWDAQTLKYIKWNKTFRELTGYSDDEIATMNPVADFFDDSDLARAEAAYARLLQEGRAIEILTQINKDGNRIPLEYTGAITHDNEGNPMQVIVIGRDITERKRAEEQLRFQALLLDTVEQSVIVTDLDGQVVYWNPFAERLFGWSAEEALGRNTAQLMRDVDDEQVLQKDHEMRASLDSIGSWSGEYIARRRDGTHVPLQSTITMVTGVAKQPTHIIGISEDISERKRAEKALQDSEKEYRNLVEKISDIIYAVDTNGMITYLNPAVEALIGLPPEELVGQPFAQFIHPDDLGRMQANVQSLLSGVVPDPAEYRVLATSGEPRWIRVSSQPVRDGDQVTGLQGVLTDITERKRVEEQLEEAATATERQRLARELHDSVTQTLYSIDLFSNATQQALSAGKFNSAKEHASQVRGLSQSALADMRLLIFELRPPELEKEGLVNALRKRLELVESRAGVETVFEVNADRPLSSSVENNLYAITIEALNNTLKHAQAELVSIKLEYNKQHICLTISDNGIGFDPQFAEKSHGFGLRNMRERVENMDGRMTLDTSPGKGTIISVKVTA
ncbi:MAG: PAS domain S-box protein [Chloroflexota bacterium]|nr:MAG: PAS domain S-box protein [Chloroflexota bacterium]